MRLFAISAETRRGSGGSLPVEAACHQLWGRVDGVPPPQPSVRTEKLLLFILSFCVYRSKDQRVKNMWPKTGEKTRFGDTIGFSLSWTTLANVRCAPPQPENSFRATDYERCMTLLAAYIVIWPFCQHFSTLACFIEQQHAVELFNTWSWLLFVCYIFPSLPLYVSVSTMR